MNADLQRVRVCGHSVGYRRAGSGPPLVLLHGFLCDSRVWRTQLSGLSNAFDVVAWDAPGAGESSDPRESFTIADWAECLDEFLSGLEIDAAHVLGMSWGGMLAQELYRWAPERVASLILAGAYAGWRGSFPPDVVEQRLTRCIRESELPASEFVTRWVPEFFTAAAPRELRREMSAIVGDFHPSGFRLMARSLAETDTTELLPTVAVPTLLVWGEEDIRSPLTIATRFKESIPGAELAVIPDTGHISNMERPSEFNECVRRFCEASQQQAP